MLAEMGFSTHHMTLLLRWFDGIKRTEIHEGLNLSIAELLALGACGTQGTVVDELHITTAQAILLTTRPKNTFLKSSGQPD